MKRKMGLNSMHSTNLNIINQHSIEKKAEKDQFKMKNEQRKEEEARLKAERDAEEEKQK